MANWKPRQVEKTLSIRGCHDGWAGFRIAIWAAMLQAGRGCFVKNFLPNLKRNIYHKVSTHVNVFFFFFCGTGFMSFLKKDWISWQWFDGSGLTGLRLLNWNKQEKSAQLCACKCTATLQRQRAFRVTHAVQICALADCCSSTTTTTSTRHFLCPKRSKHLPTLRYKFLC